MYKFQVKPERPENKHTLPEDVYVGSIVDETYGMDWDVWWGVVGDGEKGTLFALSDSLMSPQRHETFDRKVITPLWTYPGAEYTWENIVQDCEDELKVRIAILQLKGELAWQSKAV